MLKDFKAFVMRGNVLDLAVAVIIGAAFGAIVTSMVNDIAMPPILSLNGQTYPTVSAAPQFRLPPNAAPTVHRS